MKYSLTVLFFIIFPLQFYSQDKAESSEMLSVLTVFLDDFKKNQISKPVEVRILKETEYKLHPQFLNRLRSRSTKYVEPVKPLPADSLSNMSYLLNSGYKKYFGIFKEDDWNHFVKFENNTPIYNYNSLTSKENIKVLDSISFYSDEDMYINDFLVFPRIIVKGPFLNQSKNIALLEVTRYYYKFNSELMFLVYIKRDDTWQLLGDIVR